MQTNIFPFIAAIGLLSVSAAAQDDCNTPSPISGLGSFLANTTANTTSQFTGAVGCNNLNYILDKDTFFVWTATTTGDYGFSLENSSFSAALRILDGSDCSAPCLDYNGSGQQAGVPFNRIFLNNIAAGDTLLIQVGGENGASGAVQLDVDYSPCTGVADDAFEDNDSCQNPQLLTEGTYLDLLALTQDPDYYAVDLSPGARIDVEGIIDFDEFFTALRFEVLTDTCSSFLTPNNEWSYLNDTGTAQRIVIKVATFPIVNLNCLRYDLVVTVTPDICTQSTDTLEENDTCATALPIGPGTYTNLVTWDNDWDYYKVVVPNGETLTVDFVVADTSTAITGAWYNDNCQYLGNKTEDIYYQNYSGSPQTIRFLAYPTPGTWPCTNYDMFVDVSPSVCQGPDDRFEGNNTCATASYVVDGFYEGLVSQEMNPDLFQTCVAAGETLDVTALYTQPKIGGFLGRIDTFVRLKSSFFCGQGNSFELLASDLGNYEEAHWSWTNTTGQDQEVVFEFRYSGVGHCLPYDLLIDGSRACNTVGSTFCDPMDPNSTGLPTIGFAYRLDGAGVGVHLEAEQGPPFNFGYWMIGTNASQPGIQVDSGRFCLAFGPGDAIGRFNLAGTSMNSIGAFDSQGVLQSLASPTVTGTGFDIPATAPFPGSPLLASGHTWHFQLWHRDVGGFSNFSNGITLQIP